MSEAADLLTQSRKLTRAELADICGCKPKDIPSAPVFDLTNYHPPGPVCAAYIDSRGPIDAIMGPGGSGKTVGSFFKVVKFAVGTMPVCRDGVVRCRATVLRDNYRSLYRTTLRSWFQFFPPEFPKSAFVGGVDRPARHDLQLSTVRMIGGVAREVPVDLTVDFFAVGDVAIEELLKSYETTIGYCNESDQLHIRVVPFLFSRTGRYPMLEMLPPGVERPRLVAVDLNPPKPNHDLLKACQRGTFKLPTDTTADSEAKADKVINFFQQPSGLAKDAENRAGKTLAEYEADMQVLGEDDARRMVLGLPGFASDGKPVYAREFNRRRHVASGPLAILPGVPLDIGFDQGGLNPAAIVTQTDPRTAQMRVLRELVPGHGTGLERFVEQFLILLAANFRGCPPGMYASDPAGFYGADKVQGTLSWSQGLSLALGHAIYPAPSNEPEIRWSSVRQLLRLEIMPDVPAILIDPQCEMLIEGFEAEYKLPKHRDGAPKAYGDRVVDNIFTNPHDALQYICLAKRGQAGVLQGAAQGGRAGNVVNFRTVVQTANFNVF